MALGFGFNKAKVLSAAEKYVQQGKLPNAIAEYEKVIREDPKDLTVLNTIGDLYARVGQNDQAVGYFRKVGDQYAQNGFTVKAIAIYKKLTKLSPSAADCLTKLAELYTQQGLFNDARAQYMQVADQLLKAGDNGKAARVFQKILELDPENTTTQSKLADLYIKLGKRDDARNIYYSAAESLFARKSFDAADEALGHVLSLDPGNAGALLLRGMIASGSGKSQAAVEYLEKVPDIDSRPDALRALLRAKLATGSLEGVEAQANKLLNVHNDISGISILAQWFVANQYLENGLKLYDKYADRFLSGGRSVLNETLYPIINRIRDNAPALLIMMRILQKAGESSHVTEVMELLAHAYVQVGRFDDARDLYKELAELEPENPLHNQNYKQMTARLGDDSLARPLDPLQGEKPFMVEEMEQAAPVVHQEYEDSVEKAIEAALTDSELFISYNVPSKAISPLEDVLALAPRDARLNQRLATLYTKADRYAEGARACQILAEVYREFGHNEESEKYALAARDYEARAASVSASETAKAPDPRQAAHSAELQPPAEPQPSPEPKPAIQEFTLDVPTQISHESPPPIVVSSTRTDETLAEPPPKVPESGLQETATTEPGTHEIDLSGEWDMLSDEIPGAEALPAGDAAAESVEVVEDAVPVAYDPEAITEKIQEAQFYISQRMWEEAKTAVLDLSEMAPNSPEITELISAVSAGQSASTPAKPVKKKEEPPVVVVPPVADPTPEPAPIETAAPINTAVEPEPVPGVVHEDVIHEEVIHESVIYETPVHEAAPPAIELAPPAKPAAAPVAESKPAAEVPAKIAEPPAPEKTGQDFLNDFVLDLESSLTDFPVVQTPSQSSARPAESAQTQPSASNNGEMQDPDSTSVLSDILSELQDDEAEAAAEEDPDTHYNLGIAFKEMGLLDEAIGELQKVCHAVDRGVGFTQPIQAYTWLAQCLVDKGVPEAAVRWYEKALHLPGLDTNSRCSIYYDLASAYEAFGDKKSALTNFMEVYGSNIDFRDVASRIKFLKS
jgi:pilus assembly protein FimV